MRPVKAAWCRRWLAAFMRPLADRRNYFSVGRAVFVITCMDCGAMDRSAGADAGCLTCMAAVVILT